MAVSQNRRVLKNVSIMLHACFKVLNHPPPSLPQRVRVRSVLPSPRLRLPRWDWPVLSQSSRRKRVSVRTVDTRTHRTRLSSMPSAKRLLRSRYVHVCELCIYHCISVLILSHWNKCCTINYSESLHAIYNYVYLYVGPLWLYIAIMTILREGCSLFGYLVFPIFIHAYISCEQKSRAGSFIFVYYNLCRILATDCDAEDWI